MTFRLRTAIANIQTLERVTTGYLPYAESWVDKSETIVLIGEAAHPFPVSPLPVSSRFRSHIRGLTCNFR